MLGRGSIPQRNLFFWAASIMGLHWPCKSVIGVRFPSGPPSFVRVLARESHAI